MGQRRRYTEEYRRDQADDGVPIGEDAHDIRAPADLPIQPLSRVIRPDLGPHGLGRVSKRALPDLEGYVP